MQRQISHHNRERRIFSPPQPNPKADHIGYLGVIFWKLPKSQAAFILKKGVAKLRVRWQYDASGTRPIYRIDSGQSSDSKYNTFFMQIPDYNDLIFRSAHASQIFYLLAKSYK
tara:strand:+ start:171 stop:509 length:339 start_codon:yes stop_codon:yes gene_type:complete